MVKRSDRVKGFVVQPRRWVVERTIAWLNRCRRLAKDSGRTSTATRSPSSGSRPFDSCSENSVILHKVSGRTSKRCDRVSCWTTQYWQGVAVGWPCADQQLLRNPMELAILKNGHDGVGENAAQFRCVAEDLEDVRQHLKSIFRLVVPKVMVSGLAWSRSTYETPIVLIGSSIVRLWLF